MNRSVLSGVLTLIGIVLLLLSIVGFIPRIEVDYDVTSIFFVLGLVFLIIAFFMRSKDSGERGARIVTLSQGKGGKKKGNGR